MKRKLACVLTSLLTLNLGITASTLFGHAAGEQAVEIPFTNVKFMLSARALSILQNSFVVEL